MFLTFNYSTTARISSSRSIVYSSPSTLTSVPEYLLIRTLSPTLSCTGTSFPSTVLPGPTATTSATWGFSCAALVRIIPPFVVSYASSILITTLSDNGLIVILNDLLVIFAVTFLTVTVLFISKLLALFMFEC